jgi:hypothetical protein
MRLRSVFARGARGSRSSTDPLRPLSQRVRRLLRLLEAGDELLMPVRSDGEAILAERPRLDR